MPGVRSKKLIRSIQVLFPGLPDAKFAVHNWYYRSTGRLFKADYGGISRFPWRGQLLVDIGANRGQSIVAFRNLAPDCRIVAFDANSVLAERLARRYSKDRTIQVEACALSSSPVSLTLYVPFYKGYMFDGLASLDRRAAEDWLNSDRLYWFDQRKITIQELRVPARTLDSFALAPAFMKLSVQRAEILVLEGAEETLARHRPVLLCASPWEGLIEFLGKRGYRPHAFHWGQFTADALGRDFTWFLLNEHVRELKPE